MDIVDVIMENSNSAKSNNNLNNVIKRDNYKGVLHTFV